MHVITISGDLGSGKSTVAKMLANELSLPMLSTGALHRQIAADRNLSTLELNAVATSDPSIDRLVDGELKKLNDSDAGVVVDSRMGWWFIPRALKVHLLVSPRVGAARAHLRVEATERYSSKDAATAGTVNRSRIERERFLETYGVDIRSLRNYDVVIDTTFLSPGECVEVIMSFLAAPFPREGDLKPRILLLPPARIYPTERVTVLAGLTEESIALLCDWDYLLINPVPVVYDAPVFVAVDGHKRMGSAIMAGRKLIPCLLVGEGDEPVGAGLTAIDCVLEAAGQRSRWFDWEDAHNLELEPPHP